MTEVTNQVVKHDRSTQEKNPPLNQNIVHKNIVVVMQ